MQGHKQPLDCDEDGKASTSGNPIGTAIYIKEQPIDLDTSLEIKTEDNIFIKEEPMELFE